MSSPVGKKPIEFTNIPQQTEGSGVSTLGKTIQAITKYTTNQPITLLQRITYFFKNFTWISRNKVATNLANSFAALKANYNSEIKTNPNIAKDEVNFAIASIRNALDQLKGPLASKSTEISLDATTKALNNFANVVNPVELTAPPIIEGSTIEVVVSNEPRSPNQTQAAKFAEDLQKLGFPNQGDGMPSLLNGYFRNTYHVMHNLSLALSEYAKNGNLNATFVPSEGKAQGSTSQPNTVEDTFKAAINPDLHGGIQQNIKAIIEVNKSEDMKVANKCSEICKFIKDKIFKIDLD